MNTNNDPTELRRLLRKYILAVTFTKKDGTDRVMKCTLNMNRIPKDDHPKGGKKTREDDDPYIPVWDMEKEAWRAFNAPSVNDVTVVEVANNA